MNMEFVVPFTATKGSTVHTDMLTQMETFHEFAILKESRTTAAVKYSLATPQKKLNIELLYELAILLPGVNPKQLKARTQASQLYTKVHSLYQVVIICNSQKGRNNPRHALCMIDEWINNRDEYIQWNFIQLFKRIKF